MNALLHNSTGDLLRTLLAIAWLAPLAGFAIEVFGGYWSTRRSKTAAYLAIFCIFLGFCTSATALCVWGNRTGWTALSHPETERVEPPVLAGETANEAPHPTSADQSHRHAAAATRAYTGSFYTLAKFGDLIISLDYYIDSLTLVMFTMVTLIATCIHVFAVGYMSDELTEDYVDHQVHMAGGDTFTGRDAITGSSLTCRCFRSRCWGS